MSTPDTEAIAAQAQAAADDAKAAVAAIAPAPEAASEAADLAQAHAEAAAMTDDPQTAQAHAAAAVDAAASAQAAVDEATGAAPAGSAPAGEQAPVPPAPPQPVAPSEATAPVAAVPSPQFGGATPDQAVATATAQAKSDPGFVVAKPLLTTGAYGHDVAVLAKLLEIAGHPNAIAAGTEAPMLTDELMRQVVAFQVANGIDPTKPQHGVGEPGPNAQAGAPLIRKDHEGIVEWRTWAALYDAAGEEVELEVDAIRYPVGAFA